jgi:hypothetical protein
MGERHGWKYGITEPVMSGLECCISGRGIAEKLLRKLMLDFGV